jgi:coenzyme F420-reducing hydrogenase delta subunit
MKRVFIETVNGSVIDFKDIVAIRKTVNMGICAVSILPNNKEEPHTIGGEYSPVDYMEAISQLVNAYEITSKSVQVIVLSQEEINLKIKENK